MVSTYLSYDLVVRDMKASLDRTASDAQVAREAAYYEENIGKVTSVEEFLDDYQLYSYAMKAYGLEDMTYATAFMKKVLESGRGNGPRAHGRTGKLGVGTASVSRGGATAL